MQRLKKGDEVIVNAGKDRGRRGTVLRVQSERVVVEGVNVAKKHVRPDPNKGVQGGIVEKELSIHASNVNIYNPDTDKGDRIGFRFLDENGVRRKVRYFKSNDEVIDA